MRCFECGKEIPNFGNVCPYCHRDTTRSGIITGTGMVVGVVAGVIGARLGGLSSALGGLVIGMGAGMVLALVLTRKTDAPSVQVESSIAEDEDATEGDEVVARLETLKQLKAKGLIGASEYKAKRAEIMREL